MEFRMKKMARRTGNRILFSLHLLDLILHEFEQRCLQKPATKVTLSSKEATTKACVVQSNSTGTVSLTTLSTSDATGCSKAICAPLSLAKASRGPLLTLAQPLPLLTAANVAFPSLFSLPPNPNGLSCCNCAGRHPFVYCPQPTMLQVIASGKHY